jgi:hypothetical protein
LNQALVLSAYDQPSDMKIRLLFILVCSTSGLFQCQDNLGPEPGKLVFTFTYRNASDGRKYSLTPDEFTSLIRISKRNANSVETYHNVELSKSGNQYTTAPLTLAPGNYRIEDFQVMKEGDPIFAAVSKGRILSTLEATLKPEFIVSPRGVNTIPLEVGEVNLLEPGLSFRQEILRPLNLSVFVYKNGRLKRTQADFELMRGDSVLFNASLSAKLNVLPFPAESSATYKLVISKAGYHSVIMDFNYEAYLLENGTAPLEIILEEKTAASFTAVDNVTFYLTFLKAGTVTVDWPDGTKEIIDFKPQPADPDKLSFQQVANAISGTGRVTLTGDVDKIVELITVTPITTLDIPNLKNLQSLTLENAALSHLDLRRNESLTTLGIINTSLERISLPDNHVINSVQIESTSGEQNSLPLNYLIDDIYQNSVTNNIREGAFILFNAGEISRSSLQKLEHLQTAYSWYVEIE